MIINTNISSLKSQSYIGKSSADLATAMERLSSGKRINSAKDDAAGLAITERLNTQVRGLEVAQRNVNDGVSLLQTAEGAMGSISDVLQRMRELAVQADNGTYSPTDKESLQAEFDDLVSEITHIASTTNFNGVNLLDGSSASLDLHISNLATDKMTLTLENVKVDSLGVDSLDIEATAGDAITAIDAALDTVSAARARMGSYMNRLEFTSDNLNTFSVNTSAAKSRIEDANMATESANLTKSEILNQTAIAMLSKANQNPQAILNLIR